MEVILGNCKEEHPKVVYGNAKMLEIERLQELIKKKEDPSYEINMEIMRDQQ